MFGYITNTNTKIIIVVRDVLLREDKASMDTKNDIYGARITQMLLNLLSAGARAIQISAPVVRGRRGQPIRSIGRQNYLAAL